MIKFEKKVFDGDFTEMSNHESFFCFFSGDRFCFFTYKDEYFFELDLDVQGPFRTTIAALEYLMKKYCIYEGAVLEQYTKTRKLYKYFYDLIENS